MGSEETADARPRGEPSAARRRRLLDGGDNGGPRNPGAAAGRFTVVHIGSSSSRLSAATLSEAWTPTHAAQRHGRGAVEVGRADDRTGRGRGARRTGDPALAGATSTRRRSPPTCLTELLGIRTRLRGVAARGTAPAPCRGDHRAEPRRRPVPSTQGGGPGRRARTVWSRSDRIGHFGAARTSCSPAATQPATRQPGPGARRCHVAA